MGAPNLAMARSTISMALSTPAQKPRGSARMISLTLMVPASKHADQPHLEGHRLACQGMVEVESHCRFVQLDDGAGVAALPIRRRELHHVAHGELFVGVAHLRKQAAR